MTTAEFKRVARLLKEIYAELEKEALKDGFDIFSDEYIGIQSVVRERTLARLGFTIEEYREAKELVAPAKKVDVEKQVTEATTMAQEVSNRVDALSIPNEEEILAKAKEIADAVVKAPTITNQIVKERTIEKPTILEKTIVEHDEFDASPLWAELGYLNDRLDSLPQTPEIPDFESRIRSVEREIKSEFMEKFEEHINTLNMPDFRKLAMGLTQQIDTKIEGVNVRRITVSPTAPENPHVNDLWIEIP